MTAPNHTPPCVTFKDAVGFPGYRVGDDGSVWSCRAGGGIHPGRWKPLKPGLTIRGYKFVALRQGGKYQLARVHRLVLEAFVGPCPEGYEGCHNNGIPTDNRLANLRWGTRMENMSDKVAHGTDPKGERHPSAKLDDDKVRAIRAMREAGHTMQAIAARFGVSDTNVCSIVNRKHWRHV